MAQVTIKDFIISMGFESDKVTKGLDSVSKQVKGFSKEFIGAGNAQNESSKKVLASTEAITTSKKKQLAVDKQAAKVGTLKKGKAVMLGPDFKDIKRLKRAEDSRVAGQKRMYNLHSQADNQELKRKKAITDELQKASKIRLEKAMEYGPSKKDMTKLKKGESQRVAWQQARHKLETAAYKEDAARQKALDKPAKDAAVKRSMAQRAIDKTANKFRGTEETQAGREDNRREKEAVKLTKKLATAQEGVQRKLDGINRKYGESNKLIREKVIAEGAGSKRADTTVQEVNKLKKEYEDLLVTMKKTKTASGLAKVNQQLRTTAQQTTQTTQKLDKLNRKLTAGKFAAKGMSDSLRNMSRSYVSVFAIGAGAVGMGRMGQDLIASKAALLGASGSAEQAGKDFKFLQENSQNLGVGLRESAAGYAKVGAAARSAGLGVEKARSTFLAAQEVATSFNLTPDDTTGIFRAFSQILSKGKLSTEELLQLGERVPIAFQAAADAMGMSTQDMLAKIETGKIQSVNFLPNFADELREFVNESGMLDAALETSRTAMGRFRNSFENNVLQAFDSGAESGLADFFNHFNEALQDSGPMFRSIGAILGGALSIIGLSIRALTQVTRPLFIALEALADWFNETTLSADGTTRQLGFLKRAFYGIAAAVLLPFAGLEQLSILLEDADNWVKILGGTLLGALGMVALTKFTKKVLALTGAMWAMRKVFSAFGGMGLSKMGKSGALTGGRSGVMGDGKKDAMSRDTKSQKMMGKGFAQKAIPWLMTQIKNPVTLAVAAAAITGIGIATYDGPSAKWAKPTGTPMSAPAGNTTNSGNKTEVKNTFNINGGVPSEVESAINRALENTLGTSMSTGG